MKRQACANPACTRRAAWPWLLCDGCSESLPRGVRATIADACMSMYRAARCGDVPEHITQAYERRRVQAVWWFRERAARKGGGG